MAAYSQIAAAKEPASSAVLITGGAKGIGRDTASYIISKGYLVLVTVRKQSQYDEMLAAAEEAGDKLPYPILLDVTRDDHIPTATMQVKDFLKKYDKELIAVVNNAGVNPEGDKMNEGGKLSNQENKMADPSIGSLVFETNVIGVGRIAKAFLPFLPKGGTIVNIGSYFGSIAGELGLDHCYYESSKFALEGMTDNMRRSLKKEGIRVVLIKPGNIITAMNPAGEVPTEVVASDILHAIVSSNPKARYYPGKVKGYPCRFVCWVYEMLPTWLVDSM